MPGIPETSIRPVPSARFVGLWHSPSDDERMGLLLALNASALVSEDQLDWGTAIGTAANIAALLGFALVVAAFFGGFASLQAFVFSARRHLMIVRRARKGVVSPSAQLSSCRRFGVTYAYMRRRAAGEALSVADELVWLTSVTEARDHRRPRELGGPVLPLTFGDAFRIPGAADDRLLRADVTRLNEVVNAYRRYSIRVGSRLFLRAIARPISQAEQELASAAATHLAGITALTQVGGPTAFQDHEVTDGLARLHYELEGSTAVELAPSAAGVARRVAIATWHRGGLGHSLGFPILATDYEPVRFVGTAAAELSPDGVPLVLAAPIPSDAVSATDDAIAVPEAALDYDGVLTRLQRDPSAEWDPQRRRGFREERDPLSGRLALHLSLAQVTYSTVKRYNYAGVLRPLDDPTVGCASLLTLNLLCIDSLGRVVLVERSSKVPVHPHMAAGTVSGNAELSTRIGIESDLDADGFPDLLFAASREAREEVGLVLGTDHDSLAAVGLHTISSEYERGTHVLTFVSSLREDATTWIPDVRGSDPLEGAWEVGDHLIVIDLRRAWSAEVSRKELFVWLKSDLRLTAHAVGGLLLAGLAGKGNDYQDDLQMFIQAEAEVTSSLPETVQVRRWRELACSPTCPWWADAISDPVLRH